MKHYFNIQLLSLIGLLLWSTAWAQKQKKTENSLLWKISKEGISKPSYLFGTIHIICEEDYFWTGAMQKSFEDTKQLCIEMDISNNTLSMETASLMMDLSGGTLRDYFSNEQDFQLVKKYIEDSLGQNMQIIERMKPVVLYMIYSVGLIKGPCKESVSYELKLVEKANNTSKKTIGLETVAEQMEALESIPTDSIIAQMVRIAKGQKNDNAVVSNLINAYKKQDLNALNKMIVQGGSEMGMNNAFLIDNRNKKWLQPMAKMMVDNPTFFAVGAGHVFGLLQLLKEAGYKVEAIH
jgi:uncharacterized protein YbaP (TraB family)